ncbi:MAG: hypothetical protein CME68_10905 [Halobacteriovoraceae bacterium]|nr:hypothetical protein [Halobacteriovoraceae bacterium]
MFSISFYLRRPFIFLGLLCLSFNFILLQESCFALTYFQVETLKGESLYNQKTLKKNDKLKEDGLLKVSKKSFLGILLPEWNARIVLAPGSQLEINFGPKKEKKLFLKKGALRWSSHKSLGTKELMEKSRKGFLFTKKAKMVIRGTDFIIQQGVAFNETELVVLDGKVLFQSLSDEDDYVVLKLPYWVGIGGRFTSQIGVPIKLDHKIKSFYGLILRFQ